MQEMTAKRYQTNPRDQNCVLCKLLDRVYLGRRGVRAGSMFGSRAYFVGRRLMACVTAEGVCLRVGPHRATKAIASGAAIPFSPHGRAMRGWVEVDSGRLPPLHKKQNLFLQALDFSRRLAAGQDR